MKKGPCGPFVIAPGPTAVSGGQRQGLDLGRQAALQASGLVLVEDALVGDRIDHALGRLEGVTGLGLVAGGDSLQHALDSGAEFGAQRGVGRVELDVLTSTLAAGGNAYGLLLGFGSGGHR